MGNIKIGETRDYPMKMNKLDPMKAPNQTIRHLSDYSLPYVGTEGNYYQIHMFSVPLTVSTYYNPEEVSIEQLEKIVDGILVHLKKTNANVTSFRSEGKFIITEDEEIIDTIECLKLNLNSVKYEQCEGSGNFYKMAGWISPSGFIQDALKSFGALELLDAIKVPLGKLEGDHKTYIDSINENRILDKENPLKKLELHQVNENFSTSIIFEYQFHNDESIYILPEVVEKTQNMDNIALVIRDLKTNEIIESGLKEAIENASFGEIDNCLIDVDHLRRMELDDDDPEFLPFDQKD